MQPSRSGNGALLSLAVFLCVAGCGETAADPAVRPTLSLSENPIERTRAALGAAELSFDAVVYKFDEPSLLPALAGAVERGVDVRLLVDEAQLGRAREGSADDEASLVEAARKAGVDARVWSRKNGKLHAKFAIMDGRTALAGSFNWTRSARGDNVELMLEIVEPGAVERLAELFEQLWRRAGESGAD